MAIKNKKEQLIMALIMAKIFMAMKKDHINEHQNEPATILKGGLNGH